jgi:hypothetical protein
MSGWSTAEVQGPGFRLKTRSPSIEFADQADERPWHDRWSSQAQQQLERLRDAVAPALPTLLAEAAPGCTLAPRLDELSSVHVADWNQPELERLAEAGLPCLLIFQLGGTELELPLTRVPSSAGRQALEAALRRLLEAALAGPAPD